VILLLDTSTVPLPDGTRTTFMLAAPVAVPALRVRGVLANAVTVLETNPVFDVMLPLAVT